MKSKDATVISVVIPSYNRRECSLRLLKDVFAQEGVEFEVIVVDDCSPDDTVDSIRREFPQVTLLVNEKNGGPCVSRNRGVRAANGEIIVGLDSDVTVPDTQILARVEASFKEAPDVTGIAFRIFDPDGTSDDEPRWWHPVSLEQGRERKFETHYFSGTAYAFRREAIVGAGLFPEVLYMHHEEVELAYRILDDGGTILYDPEFSVVHHANPVSRRSEVKVFYHPRNQVLLALRCYPVGRAIFFLFPRLCYGAASSVFRRTLGDWWRAMRSAMQLSGRCRRERKVLKKTTWQRMGAMRKSGGNGNRASTGLKAPGLTGVVPRS